MFEEDLQTVRETHTPVLFHVEEGTQPQGHSTSGSHERYKSPERLEWEKEWDGIKKMKEWLLETGLTNADELADIEAAAKIHVRESRNKAWDKYHAPIKELAAKAISLIRGMVVNDMEKYNHLQKLAKDLERNREPLRRDVLRTVSMAMETAANSLPLKNYPAGICIIGWKRKLYNSELYNEDQSAYRFR